MPNFRTTSLCAHENAPLQRTGGEREAAATSAKKAAAATFARVLDDVNRLRREELERDEDETAGAATEAAATLEVWTTHTHSPKEVVAWATAKVAEARADASNAQAESNYVERLMRKAAKSRKCGCCDHVMSDAEFAKFNAKMAKAKAHCDTGGQDATLQRTEQVKKSVARSQCQVRHPTPETVLDSKRPYVAPF